MSVAFSTPTPRAYTGFLGPVRQGLPSAEAALAALGADDSNTVYPSAVSILQERHQGGPISSVTGITPYIVIKGGDLAAVLPYADGQVIKYLIYSGSINGPATLVRGAKLGEGDYTVDISGRVESTVFFHMTGQPGTGSRLVAQLLPLGGFYGPEDQYGAALASACDAVAADLEASYLKHDLIEFARLQKIPNASKLTKSGLCTALADTLKNKGLISPTTLSQGF